MIVVNAFIVKRALIEMVVQLCNGVLNKVLHRNNRRT